MDITRNWRLKTNRCQLLATRCPTTGEIRLPQQTASLSKDVETYSFDVKEQPAVIVEGVIGYAKAAR
jgi:hypothetical protein